MNIPSPADEIVHFHNRKGGAMKRQAKPISSFVLIGMAWFLGCEPAMADLVTLSYDASFSIQARLVGLTDQNGNDFTNLPSDLSINAKAFDRTGSGFFESLFGPSVLPSFEQSSFTGTGDVIVAGNLQGNGPTLLSIGDGVLLSSAASGAVRDVPSELFAHAGAAKLPAVSSDISQSAQFLFKNTSPATMFFADIRLTWTFDIALQNSSLSGQNIEVDSGYVFGLGRLSNQPPLTFFLDTGFITATAGQVQHSIGSNSFETMFAVSPGEQPIFTVDPFVGGIAAVEPIPEPNTLILFGTGVLGLLVLLWLQKHGRTSQKWQFYDRPKI